MIKYAVIAFLWFAWLGLLPGTFIAILATGDSSLSRFWWLSSLVLSVAAWINCSIHWNNRFGSFTILIASGMTLGMLADLYGNFETIRFTETLPMIILLFAIGHAFYIGGIWNLAGWWKLTEKRRWKRILLACLAIYCIIGIAFWVILVSPSDNHKNIHFPTAFYTILLSATAAIMTAAALFDKRFLIMAVGGFLFFTSDILLAVRLFQGNLYGLGDFCWIAYGTGQMMIVCGSIFAARSPGAYIK